MTRTCVADVTGDWWSVALRGGVALLAGVVIVVSPRPTPKPSLTGVRHVHAHKGDR